MVYRKVFYRMFYTIAFGPQSAIVSLVNDFRVMNGST